MMFREKSISKFYAFALAAVFSLTLAGCGGSGGGSAMMDMDEEMPPVVVEPVDPEPTPEEIEAGALADAQEAAAAAASTAAAAVAGVAANKDADPSSYAAAQAAANSAAAASAAAAAARTSQAAETAQHVAVSAAGDASKYAGMVTAAAQAAADTAADAAKAKVDTTAALTKSAAIAAERASTTSPFDGAPYAAPTPGQATANDDTNYDMKIKHTGTDVTITIKDPALEAKNDPQFVQGGMMQGGYVTMRDNSDGNTETIVVHTDIQVPTMKTFGKVHELTVDTDLTTTAADTLDLTTVDAAQAKLAASTSFPATPVEGSTTAQQTYKIDVATTTNVDEAAVFAGTFDDAAGMYKCSGTTACTVSVDSKGVKTFTGDWQFTPNPGVMVSVQDADYLHYGFWVDKTVTSKTVYNTVQTFAGTNVVGFDYTNNIAGATVVKPGKATYDGKAAGVYVHRPNRPSGENPTANAGTFTADVSLKAFFGTTGVSALVSPARQDAIEGTVSNFDLSGGDSNNWSVDLQPAKFGGDATGTTFQGATQGVEGKAKGAVIPTNGWSGSMHGPTKADPKSTGNMLAPSVAIGEFNANFNNGSSVAGGFGARRK